jgi:hypothetical protein
MPRSASFTSALFVVTLAGVLVVATSACEDDEGCCPISSGVGASMNLGGSESCVTTHDFWCSTNWRKETDQKGCPVWRYDVRAPAPDENAMCQPQRDSGPNDGGPDADAADADAADGGCCPISPGVSGCMELGGSSYCGQTCDFWCSTNWRKATDAKGCPVWLHDVRAPEPDEDMQCRPKPGADGG